MALHGIGSGTARRGSQLREQQKKWDGQIVDQARYLGLILTHIQSFGIEFAKRISAAKAAFYAVGFFWSQARTVEMAKDCADLKSCERCAHHGGGVSTHAQAVRHARRGDRLFGSHFHERRSLPTQRGGLHGALADEQR
eukprot:4340434-Pyramimonas_sp.AAC.1